MNWFNLGIKIIKKCPEHLLSPTNVSFKINFQVPHTFQVHSYKRPTVCQHCKKLLKGLIRQGLQCRDCKYNCHKKCAQHAAKDCAGGLSATSPFNCQLSDRGMQAGSEEILNDEDLTATTTSTNSRLQKPWAQSTPSAPLSSTEKENTSSSSKTGKIRQQQKEEQQKTINTMTDLDEDEDLNIAKESANIPLMRVVMSKKQTKRPTTNRALKEGWMVHYTERHSMRKKHFWRLDPKAITMFKDETASSYYKEIPLSEVLEVKIAPGIEEDHTELSRSPTHFFEIRTHTSTYFIGSPQQLEDSSSSSQLSSTSEKVFSPEKQLKTAIANASQWAQAIKQALMPVTPQQSNNQPSLNFNKEREISKNGQKDLQKNSKQINQTNNEIGHLGVQIQSEQEFSQLYQIFADEVLGSGQFGTVYGGIQRKTGKHVAVKLIDKLKFPSNKEAALRTEVEILQKVRHPSVVEFQQMLETPDRIFVVMEKLKGDMLEMILSSEKGRLSERITQFLVHQILIALQYLHSQNIVHCDLKPENILLTSDSDFPQVKLCDFGFARIIGERSFRRSVVGTPAYLAPEVLRNKGFNRSLDMWSVGVIVYVSLSGTFPFNEDEDINDQIQNAEFMYPPNPWKEVSAEAIEFISSLLQVKMSKRLTVSKSLAHIWLQSYQLWSDLRLLEKEVGERFVTHPSDDQRWKDHENERGITPVY
ncbi:unnamed protein product [Meloidogyne enterolobii]|uniref:Uncharacterized protein n=1 Tax=Meloidogyne enterolobii TaxID=390850 RepID=A0ACB0XXU3_MELEN